MCIRDRLEIMARYTGPKWKISRRENFDVYGSQTWRKRPNPPGTSINPKGRPSNYAMQFREKQKVKRIYGLMEKQFKKIYQTASKATGNTGTRMLQLLELRLDNVVYKQKLARTRNQARQYVTHGHICVNGKKVTVPSYTLSVGDEVTMNENFLKQDHIKVMQAELKSIKVPEWLKNGKVQSLSLIHI